MSSKTAQRVGGLFWELLAPAIIALLTLNIESLSSLSERPLFAFAQQIAMCLLFPGLLISMALSNNVHAFPLWLAVFGNLLFYFFLIRLGVRLRSRLRS